jgi:hypothetical protein
MSRLFLSALPGLSLVFVHAVDLEGQSTSPPPATRTWSCSSGLPGGGPECAPERRLLIDLRRRGAGAPPELESVISMGATAAGIFRLTPDQATTADSAIYAILDVERDSTGAYRIEHRVASSRLKTSGGCGGSGTGSLGDLAFGAFLAGVTNHVVQCAATARERLSRK